MTVVSNTTPLNYLVLISADDVLRQIFGQVYVPRAVIDEMRHPRAPGSVRRWAENPPDWVVIRVPREIDLTLPSKLHSEADWWRIVRPNFQAASLDGRPHHRRIVGVFSQRFPDQIGKSAVLASKDRQASR